MKIIIYGIGNMGQATARILLARGYEVECFIDKGIFERKSFEIDGHYISAIHPTALENEQKELDILVAMAAAPVYVVREYLQGIGCVNIYAVGDYIQKILPGRAIANVWNLSENAYRQLLDYSWEDDISALHWRIACEWFYNRSEKTLKDVKIVEIDREKYLPSFVKDNLKNKSVMVDSAVLNGEFAEKFIALTDGQVYGFTLHSPENSTSLIHHYDIESCELYSSQTDVENIRFGLSLGFCSFQKSEYQTISLDLYCEEKNIEPNFVRVYSMSEALPIIAGARKVIRKYRPLCAINIGHYESDFVNMRHFLETCYEFYHFRFRMHSFSGNDCILYVMSEQ